MTSPRRAAPHAQAPVSGAPRRARTPRGGGARTILAGVLVTGVAVTGGVLLLQPPTQPTGVQATPGVAATPIGVISDAPGVAPTPLSGPPSASATPTPGSAAPKATAKATATRSRPSTRTATTTRPRTTATPSPSPASGTPRPSPTASVAPSAGEKVASFARARIGYPYKAGATGPDRYDCAGLVTAAYASIGISVQHSMATQATLGTSVSRQNLRPGDIVVWGDPVSAVSIYIGNDTIVIGDGPDYGVRAVSLSGRMAYKTFIDGRRITG